MKKHLVILLISVLILSLLTSVSASSPLDDFSSEPFSQGKALEIWNNLNLQDLDSSTSKTWMTTSIMSFDVSDAGIVLALEENMIALLDLNGTVIRGYSFNMVGTYGAHWNGENIILFQNRGDLIFEFTINAEPVRVVQMNNNSIRNYQLRDELIGNRQIISGNCTYQIKNTSDMINILSSQSFSQLVRINEIGEEELIYDAGRNHTATVLGSILAFFAIAFCILIVIIITKRRDCSS